MIAAACSPIVENARPQPGGTAGSTAIPRARGLARGMDRAAVKMRAEDGVREGVRCPAVRKPVVGAACSHRDDERATHIGIL